MKFVMNKSSPWTGKNIPNLNDKIVVVTGANSGLGYAVCDLLISQNARVIMACRNPDKARVARERLLVSKQDACIEILYLDLGDMASIRAFSKEFSKRYSRLDILINNAAIMYVPFGLTKDGFELQFGTNHLGHYALTVLLFEKIRATPDARVVTVSSIGHRMGKLDFEKLLHPSIENYSTTEAYGTSKLANLLFSYELQNIFERHGISASSLAAHPGGAKTNLANHLSGSLWYKTLAKPIMSLLTQDAAISALSPIRAAVDQKIKGGEYIGPEGILEAKGYPAKAKRSALSLSDEVAKKLWVLSEKMTGIELMIDKKN